MGNPACQCPDGLKFLGLKPFLFKKVLLRDVPADRENLH